LTEDHSPHGLILRAAPRDAVAADTADGADAFVWLPPISLQAALDLPLLKLNLYLLRSRSKGLLPVDLHGWCLFWVASTAMDPTGCQVPLRAA
jgi:hypothetical protein